MKDVPPYFAFWGKSRELESTIVSYPAVFHMLDVAASARAWLLSNKPYIPGLGSWDDAYLPTLLLLIAIHDIGKFSRPFQAKRPELWPPELGDIVARPEPRHDVAGYALLEFSEFDDRLAPLLPSLNYGEKAYLWRAICGHHGRPPSEGRIDNRTYCVASQAAALAFVDDLLGLLKPMPLPVQITDLAALSWWLAGLTVISDWIGSAENWFPYPVPLISLSDYWPQACKKAEMAITQAGLSRIPPSPTLNWEALIGKNNTPTKMQEFVAGVELPSGPVLILIEDQMGSGKTEAALMLAHRLMLEKDGRGLFIALPTMATANALYDRLAPIYHELFIADAEPSLVLAHGKRHLRDSMVKTLGHHQEMAADTAHDDADETASAQCAAWIGDDRRRSFLAACGAGTIDQAVLAVLPSRHAPLRLFGLSQRVLIIDEAHAYDEYVTEELRRLIEFQTKQGGSTIVLSATLPLQTRNALVKSFGSQGQCQKDGYPLITVASRGSVCEYEMMASEAQPTRCVEIHRLDNMEAALDIVGAASARGAAVGWVRNTVKDAVTAYDALVSRGIDASVFHARFAMGDRLAIEAEVQAKFGKNSTMSQRSHVLVGTQVMEQSLDIDFDLLVSDLAPIDLILQRAGRLWRHKRTQRPEMAAKLYIISPEPIDSPAADWLENFAGTSAVYNNPGILWRSARSLFSKPEVKIPDDVRSLVESIYALDAETPAGLERKSDVALGRGMTARGIARQNLLKWDAGYSQSGGSWLSDAATPTRLADTSFTYRLAVWNGRTLSPICAGGQAWAMSELNLPARRIKTVPTETGERASALASIRSGQSRYERDIPILILTPNGDGEGFKGEIVDASGENVSISYTRKRGFAYW